MRANRRRKKNWMTRGLERLWERAAALASGISGWARRWMLARRARMPRQLRVCETASLGERRLLALVECREQTMLLAAAGSSVVLLSRLESRSETAPVSSGEELRIPLQ